MNYLSLIVRITGEVLVELHPSKTAAHNAAKAARAEGLVA